MKILIEGLSLLPPRTGIGRYTENLIHGLKQHPIINGVETFLSVFPLGKNWKRSIHEIHKIDPTLPVHRLPFPYGVTLRAWKHFHFPKIDTIYNGFDIVHSPNYVLPPTHTAKGVVTIHDLSIFDHRDWYPHQSRKLIKYIKHTINMANLIIVPSEYVRHKVIELNHAKADKICVIPYNIDHSFYTLDKDEKLVAKKKMFGQEFPYILWVSELNPRKNLPLLFKMFHQIKQQGLVDCKLILVGPGGYRHQEILSELKQYPNLQFQRGQALQKNALGDILWLEYVSFNQLKELYAAADLFVFPSWDEGFGFPVLEAMASGVPVICSNAGSLPEVVGDAAIVLPPTQHEAFVANGIEMLINQNKALHARQIGFEHIKQFQQNKLIDRVVTAYQSMFNKK